MSSPGPLSVPEKAVPKGNDDRRSSSEWCGLKGGAKRTVDITRNYEKIEHVGDSAGSLAD